MIFLRLFTAILFACLPASGFGSDVIPSQCNILLGSGGFSAREETMHYAATEIDAFLGSAEQVLVIGYAQQDPGKPRNAINKYNLLGSRRIEFVHEFPDPVQAVAQAQSIVIWGGNTFLLLDRMQKAGLLEHIRAKVDSGTPYVGISAGTVVATPTIQTTNDMPIVWPASLGAIGLVPFQINAHYFSGASYKRVGSRFEKYGGETRDDRIAEFHQQNATDVVAIPEASFLLAQGGRLVLMALDPATGKIFRQGETVVEFPSGQDVTDLILRSERQEGQ